MVSKFNKIVFIYCNMEFITNDLCMICIITTSIIAESNIFVTVEFLPQFSNSPPLYSGVRFILAHLTHSTSDLLVLIRGISQVENTPQCFLSY